VLSSPAAAAGHGVWWWREIGVRRGLFPLLPAPGPWSPGAPSSLSLFFFLSKSPGALFNLFVNLQLNKHHTQHIPLRYTLDLEPIPSTIHVYETFTKSRASLATTASPPLVVHGRLTIPVDKFGKKNPSETPVEYLLINLKKFPSETPVESKTRTLMDKEPADGSGHPHYVRSWSLVVVGDRRPEWSLSPPTGS
jgi:hypothetical protein